MTRHFYFHGLPGSSGELSFLSELGIEFPTVIHPAHWQRAARSVTEPKTSLIGFSLGAFAAIRAAATEGKRAKSLHLISPAAPLELGDFLPNMAGAPVFKAALIHEQLLRALTYGQRILASLAPQGLIDLTFATSPAADKTLLQNSDFRSACQAGIHATLVTDRQQYLATIRDYVRPWAQLIYELECPVHIYQGAEDTWTPPAMAVALSRRLGDRCSIEMFEGLGHYSTLHHSLPKILRG
jgi:pimeloyl-ACP methyl ester carboxylesterase